MDVGGLIESISLHGMAGVLPYSAETALGVTQAAARVALGAFFAFSGWHKLTNGPRHRRMLATLRGDGVPYPRFNVWFVSAHELFAGAMVALGLFAVPAAIALACICVVACVSDGCKRVDAMAPIDACDRIDDWLYLSETLYLALAIFIALTGAGPYALDALIWRL